MVYDELARRLAAEYDLLLFALTGRYQALRAPGAEITPRAIIDLQISIYRLGNTFCSSADADIDLYLQPLLLNASDGLAVSLTHRKLEVKALIRKMVVENAQQVIRLCKTGMPDYSRVLNHARSGAIGMLIQARAGMIDFKVTDTSGRKWNAKTLMRTVIRDFGYQSSLDYQLDLMRSSGVNLVKAYRADNSSADTIFTIADAVLHYKSLEEIRASVFHFNSTSQVTPYVSS